MAEVNASTINKKNTKEKILEAAIDLFSMEGFSAVSVRDITKAVGIKESALYNHYKNKDELMVAILERFKQDFGMVNFETEGLENQMKDLDPEVFFQYCILKNRDTITPLVHKMWKIVYMEQFRDKRAREFVLNEIMKRPIEFYTKAFELFIKGNKIKEIDPKLLAYEYHSALLTMSLERMLLDTDKKNTAQTVKNMFTHVKFFCDGIKN